MAYAPDPGTRRDQVARQLERLEYGLAHALGWIPGALEDVREMRALVRGEAADQEEATREEVEDDDDDGGAEGG